MNKILTISASITLLVPLFAYAGAKEDYQKTYSKAENTHNNAGTFQWTTTSGRLEAAKSAAENGNYDEAKAMATEALELAEESLAQRQQQEELWHNAVIGN